MFCLFYILFYKNPFKSGLSSQWMDEKEMMKMAFVAGASCAFDYKEKNPRATETETMSHAAREMRKLINEIEDED